MPAEQWVPGVWFEGQTLCLQSSGRGEPVCMKRNAEARRGGSR